MFMVGDAFAQAVSGSPNSNLTFLLQIAQFLPIILIFYLLLIRPQQQQAKKTKAMLAALQKGDRVVTSGGLLGTIVRIEDTTVVLSVASDVKMEFLKSAIVNVVREGAST